MSTEQGEKPLDPLSVAFGSKLKNVMHGIRYLVLQGGGIATIEQVKGMALIRRAIVEGLISETLDEFHTKKCWFSFDGKRFSFKGTKIAPPPPSATTTTTTTTTAAAATTERIPQVDVVFLICEKLSQTGGQAQLIDIARIRVNNRKRIRKHLPGGHTDLAFFIMTCPEFHLSDSIVHLTEAGRNYLNSKRLEILQASTSSANNVDQTSLNEIDDNNEEPSMPIRPRRQVRVERHPSTSTNTTRKDINLQNDNPRYEEQAVTVNIASLIQQVQPGPAVAKVIIEAPLSNANTMSSLSQVLSATSSIVDRGIHSIDVSSNFLQQLQELTVSDSHKGLSLTASKPSHDEFLSVADIFKHDTTTIPLAHTTGRVLLGKIEVEKCHQYGLLGTSTESESEVFINTYAPFTLVAIGVQGSGKSHTVASVIESCMLHCPPYISAESTVATMVFHYDSSPTNICEAATLTLRRSKVPSHVPVVQKMIVLVSPSFFKQRQEYYSGHPNCTVLPLLFRWANLDASQLKVLMRIETNDSMPLYMSAILDMLRKMQKQNQFPTFTQFKQSLLQLKLSGQQSSPLQQRLSILESFLADSPSNVDLEQHWVDLQKLFSSGNQMIIVDLTDPMLSGVEANSIFQVVLTQFLNIKGPHAKLAVFDEAHKYLQHAGTDDLSKTIVSTVRQMRHHGIRVVVSTQSPQTLPPELLELVSITVIHRFHARDWFSYLQSKLPLNEADFERIINLQTGHALVFSLNWAKSLALDTPVYLRELFVRPRITADGGASKVSKKN